MIARDTVSFLKRSLTVISFLTCWLPGIAWADQIVLKDGDRISGDIIKKDGQTVTMRSKNFGTVTLKWDDIATVTTDSFIMQGRKAAPGLLLSPLTAA